MDEPRRYLEEEEDAGEYKKYFVNSDYFTERYVKTMLVIYKARDNLRDHDVTNIEAVIDARESLDELQKLLGVELQLCLLPSRDTPRAVVNEIIHYTLELKKFKQFADDLLKTARKEKYL